MADKELAVRLSAKTDEFVKSVEDAKTKVRSLTMQMAEIDKQLKTESVDRVQKLGEKLELAKRAANMAAEEANKYGEKIAKLTAKHEDASKMTDRQKEQVLKLSEQMATAQQKANTYAAEVEKLSKELDEAESESKDAENATKELADSLDKTGESSKDLSDNIDKGTGKIGSFIEKVKSISLTDLAKKGLSKISDFFGSIASKAWDAAKAAASFAKEYAKTAVDMAAGYEDALGYSEQVFSEQSENVKKWVEDNSLSLRIGEASLIDYVNKFGALFTTFGFGAQDAAENSEKLIKLAVDLRAATGDDMNQIIESLTSGLTGGYKAFQRYGVVVNEARIKAQALSMGLVDVNVNQLEVEKATLKVTEANKKAAEALQKHGENSIEYQKAEIAIQEAEEALTKALGGKEIALDDVAKKMAILAILQGDLSFAEGQAAKESDSYSSQLALRDTLLENLQLRIGEKLLPVFTDFVTKVNEFMQSDAGKAVMDALTESVGLLADKVMELLNDEQLTVWIESLKEKIPGATEKFIEITEKIGELIPKVIELTEKVVDFFDKSQKTKDTKQAYADCQKEIHDFATKSNEDYDLVLKAIKAYAEENNKDLSEIYGDWGKYEPLIADYMDQICTTADGTRTDLKTALDGMATDVQQGMDDIGNTNTSGLDRLRETVRGWAADITGFFQNVWNKLEQAEEENSFIDNNGNERQYGRATGGPVKAGRMYQVNDDHGRRKEMFVPYVDGYILNGNDTQRVINNSTNNSRTYGDMHIYVNSYGTDAASIADEIGAELNRRLRMSGA